MWIRSQDKSELAEVNHLGVGSGTIYNAYINGITHELGSYESEERALQVLNYIQNAIKKGDTTYTMPEN